MNYIQRIKNTGRNNSLLFSSLFIILILFSCKQSNKVVLSLNPAPNSHIVFVGNTFAERLQHYNYFETFLHKSFPERNLTVRNLGWSADEINLQPRPLNFGTLDDRLKEQQADIIFACYGLNEAFKGLDSLDRFKTQLAEFLQHLKQQKYNGKSSPQIVLVSPIAHETLGGYLPDPTSHNKNLARYTEAMQKVAESLEIPFIDLYEPTKTWMAGAPEFLTINGIHLNDEGYKKVSEQMASVLDLPVTKWEGNIELKNLKTIIDEKNKQFFYLYRPVNGEYIYGSRKEPWVQPAGGPISFPSEFEKLGQMVRALDSLVWSESQTPATLNLVKVQELINGTIQFEPLLHHHPETLPTTNQFTLPEGYEINLFASEVEFPIGNPVKITFDPKGRMWLASMPSYPHYLPGAQPNDKIIILEDTDQDGKADKHIVFADSLYLPLGFELGNGGAFVTQAPNLVFLKDTDGDGKADLKNIVLHGFGTEDSHHSISAHTWGPDGALYMHDGTFLHSQIETPYGPQRSAYGTTWRFEPLTMKLEPYVSYPYANPWGNVFTRNGTHLIGDVSTGMNYFAPPLTVAVEYPKKHVEMKDFLSLAIKPKTSGMEIISSRQFPENVQGDVLFNTFIGFQGIKQHRVSEEGSGVIAKEVEPLLQSNDPNFRPVDLQFGPDGALYVVDWYNPIINHGERALRDPLRDHVHGRIWRITYKNKPVLAPVDFSKLTVVEVLEQLKTYEDRNRYRARIQLSEFPESKVIPVLTDWLDQLDPKDRFYAQHKLEGLWVHQQFNHPNEKLLSDLLTDTDEHVRTAATRVLFYWKDRVKESENKLITMSRDPSEKVRLQAIVSLSHLRSENAVNALLATTELPMDDYISYALNESFKELKPVWIQLFKKDKNFLSKEPQKARILLGSLSNPERLEVPGFVKTNPEWPMYAREPLSSTELTELKGSIAVDSFLKEQALAQLNTQAEQVSGPGKTVIYLSTVPGKMIFDKPVFEVKKGSAVSLVFDNPDAMLHNVVIGKPGSSEKVGMAADKMAGLKDGYEKSFIPSIPEVLFYTPLISGGEKYTLEFKAPNELGEYPFVCTFPGHWQTMKGIMKVVDL